MIHWFNKWRLRRARERYAYWNARLKVLEPLTLRDFGFFCDWKYHNEQKAHASGMAAKFAEQIEIFSR